jgi:hypothetical protein
MPKTKKDKPHIVDAQADIIDVLGLEDKKVLRSHSNGAKVLAPLSWSEIGFIVEPSPISPES